MELIAASGMSVEISKDN